MAKLYFEHKEAERCEPLGYIIDRATLSGEASVKVYPAVPYKVKGFFWCKVYQEVGESGNGECGRTCPKYQPRNDKSGACRHHSTTFYEPGQEVIIELGSIHTHPELVENAKP